MGLYLGLEVLRARSPDFPVRLLSVGVEKPIYFNVMVDHPSQSIYRIIGNFEGHCTKV